MSKRPAPPNIAPLGYEFTGEYRVPVKGDIAYYVTPSSNRPSPFMVTEGFLRVYGNLGPHWILKRKV